MADLELARGVPERVVVLLAASGPTAINIVEIADYVTGVPLTIYQADGVTPVVFPDAMTQTPGNNLSWFSQQYVINSAGEFIAEFDPTPGDNFTLALEVTSAGGSVIGPSAQTCALEDHVIDAQGAPMQNVTVSARILSPPYVVSGAGVSTDVVTTTTDSNGFFSLPVLRGATADVIIPEITYRRTIVVPSAATAELFSITG